MYNGKLNAYKEVVKTTGSAREIEARVLIQGALKLARCRDDWDAEDRKKPELKEALRYNRRLWRIFQTSLCAPNCPLPDELRLNLLRLGSFIDQQIFKAMVHPSPDLLEPIIEINLGLAKGLDAKPQAPVQPPLTQKVRHLI